MRQCRIFFSVEKDGSQPDGKGEISYVSYFLVKEEKVPWSKKS